MDENYVPKNYVSRTLENFFAEQDLPLTESVHCIPADAL
jgi:hypothetical protein